MTFRTFVLNATDKTPGVAWQAGYQFEFYCELCKRPWRPPFQVNWTIESASRLSLFSSFADPALSGLATVNQIASYSGWEVRRQQAFEQSCYLTQRFFRECRSCLSIVCPSCLPDGVAVCRWCAQNRRPGPNPAGGPPGPHAPCAQCGAPYLGTPYCGHCGHRF